MERDDVAGIHGEVDRCQQVLADRFQQVFRSRFAAAGRLEAAVPQQGPHGLAHRFVAVNGAAAPTESNSRSGGDGIWPSGCGKTLTKARRSSRGWGSTASMKWLYRDRGNRAMPCFFRSRSRSRSRSRIRDLERERDRDQKRDHRAWAEMGRILCVNPHPRRIPCGRFVIPSNPCPPSQKGFACVRSQSG